jgi:hypothetical protein
MIEKNSIEEVECTISFSVKLSSTCAVGLVVVNLNDIAIGEI